jgi:hypothetical protein
MEKLLTMRTASSRLWTVVLFVLAGGFVLPAAEDPVPPPNRPDPAALRERARKLSPEERQKLAREFREKHGLVGTNRSEWEKMREELRRLPPAEREAKLREQSRRRFKLLSPDEVDSKRQELKQRIDAQISGLEKLKTEGNLTEAEQRRLDRMRQMSSNMAQRQSAKVRRPPALRDSPASETDVLPPPKPAPKSAPDQ